MNRRQLLDDYSSLAESCESQAGKYKKRLLLLSFLRLLAFTGGIGISFAGFSFGVLYGSGAILLAVILFLNLVKLYSEISEKADFSNKLAEINRNEYNALSGDWSPFNSGDKWINRAHEFSNDIDLFGKDSLFQYLNRTFTGYGRAVLAGWLENPFNCSGKIKERQEAIKELAARSEWRKEFIAVGLGKSLEKEDIESLLAWLNEKSLIFSSNVKKTVLTIFPALSLITLFLLITGVIQYSYFISVFLVNLLITLSGLRQANRIHSMLSKKYSFLFPIQRLMSSFEQETFSSQVLSVIKSELTGNHLSAVKRIKKLSHIIQSFDSRLNVFVGFILNGLFLWDLHCIRALEKWKKESSDLLPGWFNHIGQIEAYISFANFAYNNPLYSWPVLSDDGIIINSADLGHPLIDEDKRVCNGFSLRDRGQVVIITGANMAGKSTFLRTVTVNLILAMTGAPVCASEMKFSPVKLFTSMRTTDSLSQNESYFYAELKRLKLLKESLEAGEELFFILDEILKGTNSADKSTGSKLFLKKIIELGGSGLIATHDISLGEMAKDYPGIISNKCFEIEINGDKITFDYRLRDGITTRMNAALLMKEMGIVD